MYIPEKFRVDDKDVLHDTMRHVGAATIVGQGPDGLTATHVPIELDPAPEPCGLIRCHFARPNPHADAIGNGQEVLLVFQGPQGYVTPNWYPSKHQTAKVVPTWNYIAVHAYGTASAYDDPEKLKRHLAAMTDHFESPYALPWKVDDAPADFIDSMCRAIVGIEIRLTRLEGKWKLSQNRTETDAQGVVNGLRAQGGDLNTSMAALVASANKLDGAAD